VTLTPNNTTLVFVEAATMLVEDGWTTGMFRSRETGARCAYGALDTAAHSYGDPQGIEFDSAYNLLADYLDENYPLTDEMKTALGIDSFQGTVTTWNDEVAQSPDEVIAVLLDVAEQLEGVAA
jgi:hypothetical protein